MPVRRDQAYSPDEERIARGWIGAMNAINVELYQWSDGRVAGRIPSGVPLLLLTTRGRVTNKMRTVTVAYLQTDDGYAVVGSNGGLSTDPAWVLNAEKNPSVVVQVGAERNRCTARPLDESTTVTASWVMSELSEKYRAFEQYQLRAGDRRISVLHLTRDGLVPEPT